MDLLNKFEKDMNIQMLKYVISKQMFCRYSGKCLDYRNAILVTLHKDDKQINCQAIDGSFEDKIPAIISKAESIGCTAEIFSNIK